MYSVLRKNCSAKYQQNDDECGARSHCA